jgi:hypothetical protein
MLYTIFRVGLIFIANYLNKSQSNKVELTAEEIIFCQNNMVYVANKELTGKK